MNNEKSWKNLLTVEELNKIDKLDAITYAKTITIMKEFFEKPKNVSVTDATGCSELFTRAIAREFREVDVFLSCKPGCDKFNNFVENNVTLHGKYISRSNNKYNNTNTNKIIALKNHLFYAEPRAMKQKNGYTYQIGRYAIYNIAKELKKGYKIAIFRLKAKDTHFSYLINKFEEVSNKIYLRSVDAVISNKNRQQILLLIIDLSNKSIKLSVENNNNKKNNKNKNKNKNNNKSNNDSSSSSSSSSSSDSDE